MEKSFSQTVIETIRGLNNEGSSKRATAFGFYWLTFIMIGVYAPAYFYCAVLYHPPILQTSQFAYQIGPEGQIQQAVVAQLIPVLLIIVGTLSTALGITAYEKNIEAKKTVDLKINE